MGDIYWFPCVNFFCSEPFVKWCRPSQEPSGAKMLPWHLPSQLQFKSYPNRLNNSQKVLNLWTPFGCLAWAFRVLIKQRDNSHSSVSEDSKRWKKIWNIEFWNSCWFMIKFLHVYYRVIGHVLLSWLEKIYQYYLSGNILFCKSLNIWVGQW